MSLIKIGEGMEDRRREIEIKRRVNIYFGPSKIEI